MIVFLMCLIVYVSLGIPDGVLGAVWPTMSSDIGVDPGFLGVISAVSFGFSFISTLCYPYLIRKFNLGPLIIYSILLVICGFILFLFSYNNILLIVAAILLGLGAGSIDSGINEYSIRHFSVKAINVLHGFWAVGVSLGALISSFVFYTNNSWETSYIIVVIILIIIVSIVFANKKILKLDHSDEDKIDAKVKGGLLVFGFYFTYAIEIVMGVYLSSCLFFDKNLESDQASFGVFLYWFGLLCGRMFVAFSSTYLKNKTILMSSLCLAIFGAILAIVSSSMEMLFISSFIIGFGFGPLYPTMLSEFNRYFNTDELSVVVTYQMAGILAGGVLLPIICGYIFVNISYSLIFIFVLIAMVIMLTLLITMEKTLKKV